VHPEMDVVELRAVCDAHEVAYLEDWGPGKLVSCLYDQVLQPTIVDPVFIVATPSRSRRWPATPMETHDGGPLRAGDRRKELANGYSELNNPDEQRERFRDEARAAAAGDLESHPADLAFIRALEYGSPRLGHRHRCRSLVMLLGEVSSIRDVILFPSCGPRPRDLGATDAGSLDASATGRWTSPRCHPKTQSQSLDQTRQGPAHLSRSRLRTWRSPGRPMFRGERPPPDHDTG